MAEIKILTREGGVLAKAFLSDDLFVEGGHMSVKTYDVQAKAHANGRAERFEATDGVVSISGEIREGAVDSFDPNGRSFVVLDTAQIRFGNSIRLRGKVLTLKESV